MALIPKLCQSDTGDCLVDAAMMRGLAAGSKRYAVRAAQKVRKPPEGTDVPRRPGRRSIVKRHGASFVFFLRCNLMRVRQRCFGLTIPDHLSRARSELLAEPVDASRSEHAALHVASHTEVQPDAQRLT